MQTRVVVLFFRLLMRDLSVLIPQKRGLKNKRYVKTAAPPSIYLVRVNTRSVLLYIRAGTDIEYTNRRMHRPHVKPSDGYTIHEVYRKGTIPKNRSRSPFRLHSLQAKLLRTYSSLVRDLLRQMVPLELPKVLEIPNVVVVVVALLAPDEGVV